MKKPAPKVLVDARGMVKFEDVRNQLPRSRKPSAGRGFDNLELIPGSTYKDSSTVIVVPTRAPGLAHYRVWTSWMSLIGPMNQRRHWMIAIGDEVGKAYTNTIKQILADPNLSKWKYVLTLEDDNIQPPDAHIRLLETIEHYGFDAVSGIYFTKGEITMPMAYGDPDIYKRTGVLDFTPRDVRAAYAKGQVMEVNGIAMGCSLYRMDLFRQIPEPWFVSVADVGPNGIEGFTQDLYFCKNAREAGKRFAVDFRVPVGHLDVNTGEVY